MKKHLFFLCLSFLGTTLIKAQPPGSYDNTFATGTGPNAGVRSICIQSDGKVIIGGAFTSFNGTANINRVARLSSTGANDATFVTGSGADNTVFTMALQTDGKLIIAGQFNNYNGTGRARIARINSNGSLDNTFNPGSGSDGIIRSIAIQTDGKIVIVGSFTTYNGTARANIARVNADGTLDTSFDPGTGCNNLLHTVKLQSDGKIVIGGSFTTYNGTSRNGIARVNTNGSLDTSFDPGTGIAGGPSPVVNSLAITSTGKIVIAGAYYTYNGTTRNRIAVLNSNGSLDTSFDPNQGTGAAINGIAIQSDGKYIITGVFVNYDGNNRNFIVRVLTNGAIDTGFIIGTGMSDLGYTVVMQTDGKAIIGGEHMTYNGNNSAFVTRINATNITSIEETKFAEGIHIYPNPGNGEINIPLNFRVNELNIEVYTLTGKIIFNNHYTQTDMIRLNISEQPAGVYFVSIIANGKKQTFKYIKH